MLIRRTEDNQFVMEVSVPCYDTDASFFLKPAAFMDLCQELAYWAASELGFGYDDLKTQNTAWVLSRMRFKYFNPPKWRDTVELATWHKGAQGLFYLRDFEMKDKDGNVLVAATSSWLIMDLKARSLVRHNDCSALVSDGTKGPFDALSPSCGKVLMPKDIEPKLVESHTVSYSDIDIIGHTNNARYAVWAMDTIDYQLASARRIKEFSINFNKETTPGEEVKLFRTVRQIEDGYIYNVEGKIDDKAVFCAEIEY